MAMAPLASLVIGGACDFDTRVFFVPSALMSSSDFFAAYARHRAREGRGYSGDDLLSLPYLREGPLVRQWRVRARTFEAFAAEVVMPMGTASRPLDILDLGAGNGWLSYRLARLGHRAT